MIAYRAGGVAVIAVVLSALLPLSPARAATEIPVLTSPSGEFQPARGSNHLAWEQNTKGQPSHYDVIVQADGGQPTRVNPGRSNAAMGGIDGNRLIYQQFRKGASDLFLYDLATGARSRLPKRVNSRMWEYWPSLSGPWLLFARWKKSNDSRRLYLDNLDTGERRILHRTRGERAFIDPGQVNGDFVVWSRCPPKSRCQVYRYQISTGTRVRLPNPGSYQRAPSVNPHGTVFFSRGSKGCGGGVRLVQVAPDGLETILVQFPEGLDSRDTFAFTDEGGSTHVYYERFGCGKPTGSDIFRVVDSEVAGSITVIKEARPSHAQDFSFTTTGGLTPSAFALDHDADGTLPNQMVFTGLPSGTYSVSETPIPAGWQLTDLVCTGGGPNSLTAGSTAVIGLDPGEDVICTFSNAKEGSITIIKDALPDHPQDFEFDPSPNLQTTNFLLDDDPASARPNEESFEDIDVPGAYTVQEVNIPSGWQLTGLECTGGGPNTTTSTVTGTVTIGLDPGEAVVCTYTNTEKGSITVVKDAVPDSSQDFGFTATGLSPSGFSLDDDADGTLSDQRQFSGLLPGTYTVSEGADPAGWQLTDITCTGGGPNTSDAGRTATIGLDPGEDVVCTFTNSREGSITVRKNAVPDAPRDFEFNPSTNLDPGANFFLDDDANPTLSNEKVYPGVPSGTYTVSEVSIHEDWTLTGLDCTGGGANTTTSTVTATATIGLDPGEDVVCTFTNSEEGSITVVKDALPDAPQNFTYSTTGGLSPPAFSLDDDADPTLPRQRVFSGLVPGTYTVSEDADPAGWQLTDLQCVGGGANTTVAGRTATIGLDPGEAVVCTFENTEEGSITVVKDALPDDPQDFGFSATGLSPVAYSLDDDADPTLSHQRAFTGLLPGTYQVSEDADPSGWQLTDIDCVGGGGNTSDAGRTATIGLDPGEAVVCTFTNTEEGSITIVEDASGLDPFGQDLEFDPSENLQIDNFFLDDDADPTLPSSMSFVALLPGAYSVAQVNIPVLFALQALDCTGGGQNTTTSTVTATATIGLDPGEALVCTFQNSAL
jgi:hypothetical protein